jgi:SP family general alpha glucoside:H+ symporter-like MFS transporter
MSSTDEKYDGTQHDVPRQGSNVDIADLKKHSVMQSDVLIDPNLMSSAYDGENYEHSQGLWTAVKSHPMAAFWAFTMCFTIVSLDTHNASLATEFGRELWTSRGGDVLKL